MLIITVSTKAVTASIDDIIIYRALGIYDNLFKQKLIIKSSWQKF